jgi:hypothetical protein
MNENFGSSTKTPSDAADDEPPAEIAQPEVTQPGPPEKASKTGTADSSSDLPKPADQAVGVLIGCLFWVIGIPLAVAMFFDAGRKFLQHWWWAVGAGIILLAALFLIKRFRDWFAKLAEEKRTAFVVFAVLPLLLVAIGTIVLLPRPNQITVVRSVFLIAVCLFPALMYYLFIAARKISLLNDYFVNLGRLGLLQRLPGLPELKWEFKVRLLNYVQKFEALYGPLPAESRNAIVGADDPLAVLAKPFGRDSVSSAIVPFFTAETAIPVVLATVLIAVGWLMALPPLGFEMPAANAPGFWSMAFGVSADPIVYAFLGAYFFSLQMLFRRYVREDLRKSAYLAVSLRIILAVMGTWVAITAITAIGKGKVHATDTSLLIVGFVIGVFPRIAWQFIQGAWKAMMRKLGLSKAVLPSMESGLPVSYLDGLTVWHEARLEEEDIENIPNMATTEIIDLMLRTRFSPDRIIDWVDQAILFTYLGPDQKEDKEGGSRRDQLRLHGIRTATSLIRAFGEAESRKDADEVEKILSQSSRSHVRSLLDAIETEPNLTLIMAWRFRLR